MTMYKLDMQFIFNGNVNIEAYSIEEAHEKLHQSVHLCLGGNIHTELDDDEVDWDISTHSEKTILSTSIDISKGEIIMPTTEKTLESRLIEFLDDNTSLDKGENNYYTQKIHVDYRGELSQDSIEKILKSDEPMDEFYELFGVEYDTYEFEALHEQLEEDFEGYEENETEIDEWINEHVSFYIDTKHYLDERVCANIIIDSGDGNYDFTLNNLTNEDLIEDDSSLLWLVNQQGYTKKQLFESLDNTVNVVNCVDSKLLETIYDECINTTTSMNALTFFVKMTIQELIEYKSKPWDLTLKKDVKCGLVDFWNGAGGILGIEVEHEVVIPTDKVRSFTIDGADGYGVSEIFGICSSFYTDGIIYSDVKKQEK